MTTQPTLPACSTWKLWTGKEIEGATDLGVRTLFIREASPEQILGALAESLTTEPIARVWFCKEFIYESSPAHMKLLCARLLETVKCLKIAFELDGFQEYASSYISELRPWGTFYIKLPQLNLLEGDHVCVGPAFSDEAFRMGDGKKMDANEYADDKVIIA